MEPVVLSEDVVNTIKCKDNETMSLLCMIVIMNVKYTIKIDNELLLSQRGFCTLCFGLIYIFWVIFFSWEL